MGPEAPWARALPPFLRLGPRLGEGSFGEVYEAEDTRTSTRVAIKFLSIQMDAKTRRRLDREAEVLGTLDHPNVMRILDRGEAAGVPYLVLELLEGESLAEGIPDAPPLEVMLPIADALVHAHGRGILHRDVKPANVLWTREGRAVLVDFGLVTRPGATRLTATGAVVGSLGYLSPELLQGRPHTGADDLWAWAVTLYELCERRLPFSMPSLEEAMGGAPLPVPAFQRLGPADPERRILEAFFGQAAEDRPATRDALESLRHAGPAHVTGGWGAAAVVRAHVAPEGGGSPAKEPGSPRLRRALTGAALLVLVAASFMLGRPATSESPASAPAPTAPAARFGPAYTARVLAELKELPSCPEELQEPWTPCPDRDPLRWGEVLGALPAARELEAWVVDGGRPERLPESVRAGLREAGEEFLRRGLPSPFDPWDRITPRPIPREAMARLQEALQPVRRRQTLPEEAGPWFGAALHAFLELDDAARSVREGRLLSQVGPGGSATDAILGARDETTRHLVEASYHDRIFRVRIAREMATGSSALRAMTYALGRSFQDEEHEPAHLAILASRMVHHAALFCFGPSFFAGPTRLYGFRPEGPFQAMLLLRFGGEFEDVLKAANAPNRRAMALRDLGKAAAVAARADPGRGPWHRRVHINGKRWLERLREEAQR